jgi:hypothetical protein
MQAEYRGCRAHRKAIATGGGVPAADNMPRMLHVLALAAVLTASDQQATRVAEQMMEAMGGRENWEQARFIRFTNVRRGRKATFYWDRWSGRLRIEAKNQGGVPYVILMNLSSRQGNVHVESRPLQGQELSEYLNRGAQMWKGAHYWFLMPLKWFDPGVNLAYEGEAEVGGNTYDIVHLTFDAKGDDRVDEYWAYVNRDTHLMDSWKFNLGGRIEGEYRWSGWQRYGGIRVATERTGNDEVIRFENVYIGTSMPDAIFTSPEPVQFP